MVPSACNLLLLLLLCLLLTDLTLSHESRPRLSHSHSHVNPTHVLSSAKSKSFPSVPALPALHSTANFPPRGGGVRVRRSPPPPSPTPLLRFAAPFKNLYSLFHLLPALPKFFLSGTIGNIIFFNLDLLLQSILFSPALTPTQLAFAKSLTFPLSYLLQLPLQHLLNAILVYRLASVLKPTPAHPTPAKRYKHTLIATYRIYATAIVLTTVIKYCVFLVTQSDFW